MIRVEGLTKYFNNSAVVKGLDFVVNESENLILLGTSGCGKTTTLRMLNRLIDPDAGKLWIAGKDISLQSPINLRRGIGYVLQHHGLFPHFTVEQNIVVVARLLEWNERSIRERLFELMEKLNLPNSLLRIYPDELSGGQQQRVGLARAIFVNPPVLLMDEPFAALDPITRENIRQEFKQMEDLRHKTIMMVTHDVQEAFALADRICLMDRGVIQQIGTPKELLFKPANLFVQHFFDAHRMQLEFLTVSLFDLFGKRIANQDLSVWDVLENRNSGHLDLPSVTSVLEAFDHYKYILNG